MKKWISSLILMTSICGLLFTAMSPQIVSAANSCNRGFLGFPAWYRGITVSESDCNIKSPDSAGIGVFIWHIALNIIEIALMAVGYITVFFIMYGGFLYLTSQGEQAELVRARKTILSAIIGLVISFASVALVNLVAGILK